MIGVLMRREYRAIVTITNYDKQAEQRCLNMVRQNKVDGIIALTYNCLNMVRQNKVDGIIALTYNPDLEVDPAIPFVSIDRHFRAEVPCVSSDNFGGGQLAARKLLQLGCRKLLFLRLGTDVASEADKRRAGFEAVCREGGGYLPGRGRALRIPLGAERGGLRPLRRLFGRAHARRRL